MLLWFNFFMHLNILSLQNMTKPIGFCSSALWMATFKFEASEKKRNCFHSLPPNAKGSKEDMHQFFLRFSTFGKKGAFWGLGLVLILSLSFILLRPQLVFNYDFESFFPSEAPELAFYHDCRDRFENDNDYLLIALGNSPSIDENDFLDKAHQLQSQLEALDDTERVISILDLEEPIISPFGINYRKVLDWTDKEALLQSSEKIRKKPTVPWEPY